MNSRTSVNKKYSPLPPSLMLRTLFLDVSLKAKLENPFRVDI